MPLSTCARITSGLTGTPQSTAATTRSTLIAPSLATVTSAVMATKVLKLSCTAMPRPRPAPSFSPQPPFAHSRVHAILCDHRPERRADDEGLSDGLLFPADNVT